MGPARATRVAWLRSWAGGTEQLWRGGDLAPVSGAALQGTDCGDVQINDSATERKDFGDRGAALSRGWRSGTIRMLRL